MSATGGQVVVFVAAMAALIVCAAVVVFYPVLRRSSPAGSLIDKSDPAPDALIKSKTSCAVADGDGSGDVNHAPGIAPEQTMSADASARPDYPPDYQRIVDHIEQIAFKIDGNSNLVFLNPSWEHLLDFSIADSLRQPITSFIHPVDRTTADAQLSSVLRGRRERCQFETRMIARNGTSHWLELRAKGDGSGTVIGTLTDISERKQVEAGLRAVRRSLSTLLNSIPGMVYRCKANRNWSFEFASDGCLDVTGYEPYQLVNDPDFYFQQIMFPDDREYAWNHVHHQVMLQRDFQLVYRIINRTGQVKWIWEQGRGVYSSGRELLALEGFITVVAKDEPHAKPVLEQFQELIYEDQVTPVDGHT